jgi:hypothetical protein
MGKGGGAPSEVSTITIPKYAQPYMEKLLGQTEALTETPIASYTGERIAGPTVAQRETRQAVQGMQLPGSIAEGTELTRMGGLESLLRSQYTPTQFQRMDVQAPQLQRYGMQAAQTGFRPDLQFYQIGAPAERGTPMMTAAQTGFRPDLTAGEGFTANVAQQYMSPYMQQVVEVQKQKAIEDAQKTQLVQNLGAAKQGTYGGARQLLAATEREKALGEQLGTIQATGTQAAYEQAAQQFERDRTARLQVQALETDVGLKTALANLDSNQQAAVQNQAAQLQMQGLNADQALRIALANQQASLGVQQLGTETGLRTALANLDAESQSRVQNLAAELEVQGMGATQALQAALANQQNFMEQQKLSEQSRQFAGQLGLEGARAASAAGASLADIGTREAQTEMAMRQMQSDIGSQAQREEQARLDAAYSQFAQEQQDPYMRLGFMSDILRGTSALQGGRAIYEAPQSAAQQILGAGLPAYAMYRGLNPQG